MKYIKILLSVFIIFLLFFLCSCRKNIEEFSILNEKAKYNIIIGTVKSEFKNSVIKRISEKYKDIANIEVVNLQKLLKIDYKNYNVIIAVDEVQAWMAMNLKIKKIIDKSGYSDKLVLFLTAGDPELKVNIKGIDAVTSASALTKEESVFKEIVSKIDKIIQE